MRFVLASRRASSTAPMIHWLGHERVAQHAETGGKTANLDRLARAGLPVPAGFCVTARAHREYLESNGLRRLAARLVTRLPDEAARRELEWLASTHPWPASLTELVQAAARNLARQAPGPARFAVRSSGIDEDGGSWSLAGQHSTALGVTVEGVEAAVRHCWASLWSRKAVHYRLAVGLEPDAAEMAVLVQCLVPADASAIVFTVDPVTGDERMLVNATWGIGEPLVSGAVTPDAIVVDRDTMEPELVSVGEKAVALVATSTGDLRSVAVDRPEPALRGDAIGALAELSLRAEDALGMPLDVEAAYSDGRWQLVQARPITTLDRSLRDWAGEAD